MKSFFKDKITVKGNIYSGITGGAVFSIFFLLLNLSLPISVIASIISYGAGLFIFSKPNTKKVVFNSSSMDQETIRKTLAELREKLNELKTHSTSIKNAKIKNKIDEIVTVVLKMYANFEKDPADIRRARQFILYYLESTVKIVRLYKELSAQDSNSKEIKDSLVKGEAILDVILHAFQVQHSRLLSNDVMDFKTEIEVLEKTLKMESME